MLGGCCGTTPDWIAAIGKEVAGIRPKPIPAHPHWSYYSGNEAFVIRPRDQLRDGQRSRCNITGSLRFKRLIKDGNFEAAIKIAREQVEGGANILDVNMDADLLDGKEAMTRFLHLLANEHELADVPIMVDSSKWEIIEAGLQCLQGKGIVNSISLKEGTEKFLEQARTIKSYGAAVIVIAFQREGLVPGVKTTGQAETADDKIKICEFAYKLLVEEVGFDPADIIFDVNILPIGTGMDEHNNYAVEFFDAVRELKKRCPYAKTSGGVSNVSFSFRGNEVVREAMNAAFLYHDIRAGLDMGIVKPEPAPGLRRNPERPAGTRRGRHPQSPARLDRSAARIRRRQAKKKKTRPRRRDVGLASPRSPERLKARPRRRHRRPHRRRTSRRHATASNGRARDRGAVDGRHERRRRPGSAQPRCSCRRWSKRPAS